MTPERELGVVLFWLVVAPLAYVIGLAIDWAAWRMYGRRAGVAWRTWRRATPRRPDWRRDVDP